jgi:hypothetical protein
MIPMRQFEKGFSAYPTHHFGLFAQNQVMVVSKLVDCLLLGLDIGQ